MTTGKTIALTRRTFVDKVMSLPFNMLSRLVINTSLNHKLSEENIGINFHNLGFRDGFLDMIPKAWATEKKQKNWILSKFKPSMYQRTLSGSKRQPGEVMATHSSILAWRILWTEEPGRLLSMGSHRVGHDWSDLECMHALVKEMATHSSILAWRIPGTGEPGGLLSMGSHRVGHEWSDLAATAEWGKYF